MTREADKYFSRRAHRRPVIGPFDRQRHYRNVIVIPALAESRYLPATLSTLAATDPALLDRTLVVVMVNNTAPSSPALEAMQHHNTRYRDNQTTLEWLQTAARDMRLQLGWVDASSRGQELPAPGGAGMARKVGCDSALSAVLQDSGNPDLADLVLFNLDADTLVQTDYLSAGDEFRQAAAAGGVVRFRHQDAETVEAQHAIDSYELYLHYYVAGLEWIGSPYAFHTVGSTMLCSALAYIKAGGVPSKRQAGEDFYFLQQLAKVGGVSRLNASMVFPSPRISKRVPFGTGPRMARALEDGDVLFHAHHPNTFDAVRTVLHTVAANISLPAEQILSKITPREAAAFLVQQGFCSTFPRLQQQHGHGAKCLVAFHTWFDGLATFRLINHLSTACWPKQELLAAWAGLQRQAGIECTGQGARELLEGHLARIGWTDTRVPSPESGAPALAW